MDSLGAPLFVAWQLTRDCNMACIHCCTDSAPGKPAPNELNRDEALRVAEQIVASGVPYVMLCGGEPLIIPHFFEVAEILGVAGIQLKIESNGHVIDRAAAERLAQLPIRSIQISLDGDTPEVYARQRIGGSLEKALSGCRAVREAGLPLEITFAPSKVNIHEAEAVLDRSVSLGAFRFNTGKLMRLGTAAKLWDRVEPTPEQYAQFRKMLDHRAGIMANLIELCYLPFTIEEGLQECLSEPPATLLILPDGNVKVAAALPHTCANLRRQNLAQAWDAYRTAWKSSEVREACLEVLRDPVRLAEANQWRPLILDQETVLAG